MRMRVAGPHHFAPVLEYLYVADKIPVAEVQILTCPLVDDYLDVVGFHSCQSQAVVWRKTKHAADASLTLCDDQIAGVYFPRGHIRLKCGKVVIKNECVFISRIFIAARTARFWDRDNTPGRMLGEFWYWALPAGPATAA